MNTITDPDPVLTRTPDGRITMDERGARTPRVAIEVLRGVVATHNLFVDLYEWCESGNEAHTGERGLHEDRYALMARCVDALGRSLP